MAGGSLRVLGLLLPICFFGCAVSPKPIAADRRYDIAISSIADGLATASLNDRKKTFKDEELLQISTFSRYGIKGDLTKSSSGFLSVDKKISGWEKTTSEKMNSSLSEFISYSFGNFGDTSAYEPRPFESTLLSFNLALNHSISGYNDLAAIEARKIGEKENFIERLNIKTLEAIKEQQSIDFDLGPDARAISKIEMIEDYPIEIFKPAKNEIQIRNSYQSAAANFLAGYIFESEGDKSLASPAYIKSIELMPNSKIFVDSLLNLDKKKNTQNSSDVLFIFELGLAPRLVTKKYRFDVATNMGRKFTAITLPVIDDFDKKPDKLGQAYIDEKQLNIELTADIRQLINRDLRDSMPKYLTMATSKALLELSSQMSLSFFSKGLQKTDRGLSRLLGSAMLTALYGRGDFDVRTWDSLPESIYMARARVAYGEHEVGFQPRSMPNKIKVTIDKPYQIVNIRIIDKNAFLAIKSLSETKDNYLDSIMGGSK